MEDFFNSISGLVPPKYSATITLCLVLSQVLGRALHSLRNGGGLRSMLASIWFGTNTPKSPAPDADSSQANPRVPLVLLLAIGTQLFIGCGTPAFKTAGTIVVTADHASDAWLDYWATARKLPGADLAELDRKDADVKRAYVAYQAAMETVYWSRKTGTAADLEAASVAAGRAGQAVVNLVLQFLPVTEAQKLKASP